MYVDMCDHVATTATTTTSATTTTTHILKPKCTPLLGANCVLLLYRTTILSQPQKTQTLHTISE